jgi:hypothetical protein
MLILANFSNYQISSAPSTGFPIVNGVILREPAILVFVDQKKPATHLFPEEEGSASTRAVQGGRHASLSDEANRAQRRAHQRCRGDHRSTVNLTYQPIPQNPIDATFQVSRPLVCHVGPDAPIAMYNFNADYIATTFINAVKSSDIKVVLTWDDGKSTPRTIKIQPGPDTGYRAAQRTA